MVNTEGDPDTDSKSFTNYLEDTDRPQDQYKMYFTITIN